MNAIKDSARDALALAQSRQGRRAEEFETDEVLMIREPSLAGVNRRPRSWMKISPTADSV